MNRQLATKALLLIPLLTLSTGFLGPDLQLVVQRFSTSDHTTTDLLPDGTVAEVDFFLSPVDFNQIGSCIVRFPMAALTASTAIECKLSNQEGRDIARGVALVPAEGLPAGTRITVTLTTALVAGVTIPVDIQLVDDVKIIVIEPPF